MRDAVTLIIRHVAEVVVDSTFSRCIPALIEGAERDPRVRAFHDGYSAERRQALVDLIARGVGTGEIRAGVDPELATMTLLGTIFYRRLITGEPFDPGEARHARGARPQPRPADNRMTAPGASRQP